MILAMEKIMINLLLTLTLFLCQWHGTGTEHRVTWYWPGEDNWGNLVADPACPDTPDASWGWRWCAVSPDLMRDYAYGTVLWVDGYGLRCVHDRTADWVRDTVDLRVPDRIMDMKRCKVWVLWRQR